MSQQTQPLYLEEHDVYWWVDSMTRLTECPHCEGLGCEDLATGRCYCLGMKKGCDYEWDRTRIAGPDVVSA